MVLKRLNGKYQILIIVTIFTGLYGYFLIQSDRMMRDYHNPILDIYCCLDLYIHENRGEFPKDQEELRAKGYLKIEDYDKGVCVFLLTNRDGEKCVWEVYYGFNKFKIHYGLTLDDLGVKDGKLYCKGSDKELLIIETDKKDKTIIKWCRSASLRIYESMNKAKSKVGMN